MSSRETTPTISGRFTSPTTPNANVVKKYPGTPKSPLLNNSSTNMGVNRGSPARQRLLSSKISAPRPINLPSLRREHAAGTDVSSASPSSSHGWGSASSSPSIIPEIKQTTSTEQPHSSAATDHTDYNKLETNSNKTKSTDPASSPVLIPPHSSTSNRVWAVPDAAKAQAPSNDFPTAAEAASGKNKLSLNDDKEYLKYVASDPNHTSWDEMVSEDLDDFSVDVIEFDDGTKVQVEMDASATESSTNPLTTSTETVSPSERFTEDYDRSYPPQKHYHHPSENYKSFNRRSEDHGYINNRYIHNNGNFDYRRHSAEGERRQHAASAIATTNSDRWPRKNSAENVYRRSSYDKRPDNSHNGLFHPTSLLQRPRRSSDQSFVSDQSREEPASSFHNNHDALHIIPEPSLSLTSDNSEEITVVQKNLMLTAAERAKKRRDEQEAEYAAAAERARQKAAALAEKQFQEKEKERPQEEKPSTTVQEVSKITPPPATAVTTTATTAPPAPKLPDTSKPWNLVAAKNGPVTEKKTSTSPKPNPSDEQKTSKDDKKDTNENHISDKVKGKSNNIEMTEDEKNWEEYVSKIKSDKNPISNKVTSNDWNSFATRLQKVTDDKDTIAAAAIRRKIEREMKGKKEEVPVEVLDYTQNEEWGVIPDHITHGRSTDRDGWVRNRENDFHQRGRSSRGRGRENASSSRSRGKGRKPSLPSTGSNSDYWRQPETTNENSQSAAKPMVVLEILKHETPVKEEQKETTDQDVKSNEENIKAKEEEAELKDSSIETREEPIEIKETWASKKSKLSTLLKEASSPIFPDFIEKLAMKKPPHISFMFELDEPDKDIAEVVEEKQQDEEEELDNHERIVMDLKTSTEQTQSNAQSEQQDNLLNEKSPLTPRRMQANTNFPTLIYRYPIISSKENGSQDKDLHSQQGPAGIYLMPQQTYIISKQFMIPYPQAGTGKNKQHQSIYLPTLSWQHQTSVSTSSSEAHQPDEKPHDAVNEWNSFAKDNGYNEDVHSLNSSSRSLHRNRRSSRNHSWHMNRHPSSSSSRGYKNKRHSSNAPLMSSSDTALKETI
ncbi:MAG: hypothetical protein EXX96DRAFT_560569 [Benjaminiella poitrasii]|nr:MAG: hypothetical protein EXX96DRAFT_560569 [Benjaminiella poitrasii]